ncbi:MAG: hypothetical protein EON59_07195 [Alphaproteobacteria bacterium]|nr:MAG: hypothetical protein EON59_07195 [Alphaproteobacteria bacterium]
MKSLLVAAVAVAVTVASPAAAAPFTPTAAISLLKSEIPGRLIDVIGVVPGMTADEAREVLAATYAPDDIRLREQGYRMGKDNVWVETTPFPVEVSVDDFMRSTGDTFSAKLTGLAGDNKVVVATRKVKFPESGGPTEDTLHAAVIEKYGTPSFSIDGRFYVWQFKDGQLVPCTNRGGDVCNRPAQSYDYIRGQEASPVDYVILVQIEEGGYWQANPRWMTTTVSDMKLINEAAFADFNALKTEWDRLNAVTAPVAAPKL